MTSYPVKRNNVSAYLEQSYLVHNARGRRFFNFGKFNYDGKN